MPLNTRRYGPEPSTLTESQDHRRTKTPAMTSSLNSPLYSYESPWENYEPHVRLQDLKDFTEAGVAPAIHDAWSLIIDNALAVPDWLAVPTKTLIAHALPNGRVSYRSKMKDYYRWRTVKRLRSQGVEWEEVFFEASEALRGTQYHAGHDAIETSYKKVQRGLRDPKTALQYYTAMSATRELVGTTIPLKKG
jgi:hypothetical protein